MEQSKQYYLGTYDGNLDEYKVIEEDKHGTDSGTFYGDKENQDNLEEDNDENLDLPNEQEVKRMTSTKYLTFCLSNYREKSSRNSIVEGTTLHTSTLPYFHAHFHSHF